MTKISSQSVNRAASAEAPWIEVGNERNQVFGDWTYARQRLDGLAAQKKELQAAGQAVPQSLEDGLKDAFDTYESKRAAMSAFIHS